MQTLNQKGIAPLFLAFVFAFFFVEASGISIRAMKKTSLF
jgi:hypothetical protein